MSNYQKDLSKKHSKFKWEKKKLKNDCTSREFKLHKTQEFLTQYFTPSNLGIDPNFIKIKEAIEKTKPVNGQKGMILYHSVGAGKTCAAISMADNFDSKNYTILWVTRNSLREVMYNDIFNGVCHPAIKGKNFKSERSKMMFLTKKGWFKPISYRSFSNLNKRKSQLYRDLINKNGKEDPLRNTLIIVDESHNLSSSKPHGLSKLEKPNIKDVKNLIYNSYEKSGDNSCRLLLLTATPGLNGMIGLINLLNYLNPVKKDRLPDNIKDFSKEYLNKELTGFNKKGKKKFQEITKKNVSFLNRTKDYNIFAKKDMKTIFSDISENQKKSFDKCTKDKNKKVECMKKTMIWNEKKQNIYRFESSLFNDKKVKDISKSVATKFTKLVEKIAELDKKDLGEFGKTFKHIIFVDEPKFVKILTSVLKANKFNFVFDPTTRKRGRNIVNTLGIKELKPKKNNKNFGIFTKGTLYKRNVSKKLISKVNKIFNERPINIYGNKLRFLIIDKNYLEGVSFFDVKYFHVLTEPNTKFEMEQLVGRVIRTCGHKGLPFDKKKGWIINVLIYNSEHKKNKVNYDKLIKKAVVDSLSKDERKKIKIQDLLIKEMEDNAFDKLLTQDIH